MYKLIVEQTSSLVGVDDNAKRETRFDAHSPTSKILVEYMLYNGNCLQLNPTPSGPLQA